MRIEFTDNHSYIWSEFALENLRQQSFWVFDVEATGINFLSEQVTQLGGVRVIEGRIETASTFASYVRPNKPIPEKIQRLTGITQEQIETAPSFAKIFPRFLERCYGNVLVTQCGYEFDYPMLESECQRGGLALPDLIRLDTKALFAYLHPEMNENFSTDFLVSFYKLDTAHLKRHDALGDAFLISQILCAELDEAQKMNLSAIHLTAPVIVKRFVLPPL